MRVNSLITLKLFHLRHTENTLQKSGTERLPSVKATQVWSQSHSYYRVCSPNIISVAKAVNKTSAVLHLWLGCDSRRGPLVVTNATPPIFLTVSDLAELRKTPKATWVRGCVHACVCVCVYTILMGLFLLELVMMQR